MSFGDPISLENVVPTLRDNIFAWLQIIYGIPGIALVLYLLVMFSMNKKKFGNNYYTLVKIDIAVSIAVYANSWVANRMTNYTIFIGCLKAIVNFWPGFLTTLRFCFNVFLPLQFFTSVILSFHRLTVVMGWATFQKYKKWWILYYLVCAIICGAHFTWFSLVWGFTSKYLVIDDVLHTVNNKDTLRIYVIFSAVESCIFLCVYTVIWAAFMLKRFKFSAHPLSTSEKRKIIQNTTVTAFANFLSFVPIIAWSIACVYFGDRFDGKLRLDLLMIVSDIKTFATPLILVIADVNVKKHIKPKPPPTLSNPPFFVQVPVSNVVQMT